MDKQTFLKRLDDRLRFLADHERKDVLYDYEEHIMAAVENGESEAAAIEKLGSPEQIAKQYHAARLIQQAEVTQNPRNLLRAILATMGLGFLNLVFVLGPFIGLLGILCGVLISGVGFAFSGLAIGAVGLVGLFGMNLNWAVHSDVAMSFNQTYMSLAFIGGGISLFCGGGLLTLIGVWLTEKTFKLSLRYLKFNMRIITGDDVKRQPREV